MDNRPEIDEILHKEFVKPIPKDFDGPDSTKQKQRKPTGDNDTFSPLDVNADKSHLKNDESVDPIH